ncbi:MAG: hypothetical protein P1U40_13700 [Coxiellaceae bacterium]|nr:hypothetical protein [Coxiellaceae bacterium]
MHKYKKLIAITLTTLALHSAFAVSAIDQQQRIQVVKNYMSALAQANTSEMLPLFTADAKLYTDSNGFISPSAFFPAFFSKIQHGDVTINGIYANPSKPNELSASIQFHWQDYKNQNHNGQFVDDFMFAADNNLIKEVNMQEKILN